MHSHYYLGKTTIDDRHWHNYEGMTSCDPNEPGHIHYMSGKTSMDDGHVHEYHNATGKWAENTIPVHCHNESR